MDMEEHTQNIVSEDSRALKRRRRQKVSFIDIESSKETQSIDLPEFQETIRVTREVRERSSETNARSLGTTTNFM